MAPQPETTDAQANSSWRAVILVLISLVVLCTPIYYGVSILVNMQRDIRDIRSSQANSWTLYHQSLWQLEMKLKNPTLNVPNTKDIARQARPLIQQR